MTDDLVHGHQEERFFNPYYKGYCYAPLYIFCGKHLLAAKLRASNLDPAPWGLEELQRVIKIIRSPWKKVKILIRGDSAYSREEIMAWCEDETDIDYVFGLAENPRLLQLSQPIQYRASQEYSQKIQPIVEFFLSLFPGEADLKKDPAAFVNNSVWYCSLDYQTLDSWSRSRRVVAKVDYSNEEVNHRFVVTSLPIKQIAPGRLYTQKYCPRGNAGKLSQRTKIRFTK